MENKIFYAKKTKKNQMMWNYIRRNKIFRAAEILIVCDIGVSYLSKYLRFLEKSGYIKCISKKRNILLDREYRFINNTGQKAPLVSNNSLFDYNINKSFDFSPDKPRKIEIPETLMKVLSSINQEEITISDIEEQANITSIALEKWWSRLKKMGVICGLIEVNEKHPTRFYNRKYKKEGSKFLYKYNISRAKEIKQALENGAYNYFNTDLKTLWIQQESTNS
ncbi:hypothetical protein ACN4FE_04430 [Aliarcobacter butzleri]|uniref:hypothetical protein n=1 Tax=Aliarcobacter butzleri TaxID=28197 RepID=UPI003AF5B137